MLPLPLHHCSGRSLSRCSLLRNIWYSCRTSKALLVLQVATRRCCWTRLLVDLLQAKRVVDEEQPLLYLVVTYYSTVCLRYGFVQRMSYLIKGGTLPDFCMLAMRRLAAEGNQVLLS